MPDIIKPKIKKIYLLPNIITAFGLSCGLFVIFKMCMTGVGEVNEKILNSVTGILLLAALADLLDGAIARVIKAESEFGGLFDSLADAISFGVAPSVIVLKSLSAHPGSQLSFFATMAAMIYTLCGVLRLVRFSVSAHAEKDDAELAKANKKHFTGLPIPAAAAAIMSLTLFLFSDEFAFLADLSLKTKAWLLIGALLIIGYCMISRWKFPSVKSLNMRVASFRLVCMIVISAVFIFYGILSYFSIIFLILSWGYVLIAWSLAVLRVIAGRRTRVFEEFEPEPDDLDFDFDEDSKER